MSSGFRFVFDCQLLPLNATERLRRTATRSLLHDGNYLNAMSAGMPLQCLGEITVDYFYHRSNPTTHREGDLWNTMQVFSCVCDHYVERGEGQSFWRVKQPSPTCAFAPTHIEPWCGRCGGVYSACTARSCYFISGWLVHWKFFLGCSGMIVNPTFFHPNQSAVCMGVFATRSLMIYQCVSMIFYVFLIFFNYRITPFGGKIVFMGFVIPLKASPQQPPSQQPGGFCKRQLLASRHRKMQISSTFRLLTYQRVQCAEEVAITAASEQAFQVHLISFSPFDWTYPG